ncbi:MAG: S-methyl-5'-thioadenosine phosphorylase [Betaproteobacteria bacterium]|nr:S-methyl-5'-thioadenosine phosphorylase [Betaproteobacteria bacterium]
MEKPLVGVLGGSGLYQMDGLTEVQEHMVDTPYGLPSDAIFTGTLNGTCVAFLARHGRGHRLLPSEVPYRANLYALKSMGIRYLISVSAVGSLREDIQPLDMVLPNQFIDLTRNRSATFFGDGAVAHVSMAQPVCPAVSGVLAQAIEETGFEGLRLHREGTYVCIEGPSFSSLAESNWYRSMGADVIGMTNMPEAKLAREAQLAYATLALVTDFDCWHPREAHVTADLAITNLMKNATRAQKILVRAIALLAQSTPHSIAHAALSSGLVTKQESMTPQTAQRLSAILGT